MFEEIKKNMESFSMQREIVITSCHFEEHGNSTGLGSHEYCLLHVYQRV